MYFIKQDILNKTYRLVRSLQLLNPTASRRPSFAAMKEKEKKKESKKKKKEGGNELPDHIELQRTHVVCGTERNHHVSSMGHDGFP